MITRVFASLDRDVSVEVRYTCVMFAVAVSEDRLVSAVVRGCAVMTRVLESLERDVSALVRDVTVTFSVAVSDEREVSAVVR